MNNTEIEALIEYKTKLRILISNNDNISVVKKYKKQIEIIDDLIFYDEYTKGKR